MLDWEWVARHELNQFIADKANRGQEVTPWFKLLVANYLDNWWLDIENGKWPEQDMRIDKLI